jgi:hypothetical protein
MNLEMKTAQQATWTTSRQPCLAQSTLRNTPYGPFILFSHGWTFEALVWRTHRLRLCIFPSLRLYGLVKHLALSIGVLYHAIYCRMQWQIAFPLISFSKGPRTVCPIHICQPAISASGAVLFFTNCMHHMSTPSFCLIVPVCCQSLLC